MGCGSWMGLVPCGGREHPYPFHHVSMQQEGTVFEAVSPHQTPNLVLPPSRTSQPPDPWATAFRCLWALQATEFCPSTQRTTAPSRVFLPPSPIFYSCFALCRLVIIFSFQGRSLAFIRNNSFLSTVLRFLNIKVNYEITNTKSNWQFEIEEQACVTPFLSSTHTYHKW